MCRFNFLGTQQQQTETWINEKNVPVFWRETCSEWSEIKIAP
jgi:hypothetical protein